MSKFTVIITRPGGDRGDYIGHVNASNARNAGAMARVEAAQRDCPFHNTPPAELEMQGYDPEEYKVMAVFRGWLDDEWTDE